MKILNSVPKFLVWAIWQAIRHPRTQITYFYCPKCKLRFNPNENECPKCHDKIEDSPEGKQQSPIPWYGSIVIIIIGVLCLVVGLGVPIQGLDEAGRALIYIPLGNLFGMALRG